MEPIGLEQRNPMALTPPSQKSAISIWGIVALVALALWLGGSLVLDLIVMPSLYWTGMMKDPMFMEAGNLLFGVFNRVELVLAGLTLAGLLATAYQQELPPQLRRGLVGLGLLLLSVVMVQTYGVTPSMVSLGATLTWPTVMPTVPAGMDQMHGLYFALETVKLLAGALVLGLWGRDRLMQFPTPQ